MRKFFISISLLFVLFVGAVIVVPEVIDWNHFKSKIQDQVKRATGRTIIIGGDLDFTFLPVPRLSAKDIRWANIKGGTSPVLFELDDLDIQIRVFPLIRGRLEISSIVLINPKILLERLANNQVNWDSTPFSQSGGIPKSNLLGIKSIGVSPAPMQLDELLIKNGTVVWRDAMAGSEEQLTEINLRLDARSLNGPFDLSGHFLLRNVKAKINAAIGELKKTSAAPLSLTMTLPEVGLEARINGGLVVVGQPPWFNGKVELIGKELGETIKMLTGSNSFSRVTNKPFLLKTNFQGGETGGLISGIEFETDGARLTGTIDIDLRNRPKIKSKLVATRINLDALIPNAAFTKLVPIGKRATEYPSKLRRVKKTGKTNQIKKNTPVLQPLIMPELDGHFELKIDAITYMSRNIRDIELSASLVKNIVKLTKAKLFLPGGGEVTFTGSLAARKGRPSYQLAFKAKADNFRSLLTWLGFDVAAVPGDRLRRLSFEALLRGDERQLQIQNARIGLDTSQFDGAVTVALRKRFAFGASIRIDKIDLDAYRKISTKMNAKPGKFKQNVNHDLKPLKPKLAEVNKTKTHENSKPLAVLNKFDANVNLRVKRLTFNNTPLRDLKFVGRLLDGVLEIKKADVGDISGMRASVSGELADFLEFPVFKGQIVLDTPDISGPLRLAGIRPAGSTKKLGRVRLRGTTDFRRDQASLNLALDAAGVASTLQGEVLNLNSSPRIYAVFKSRHNDLSELLRVFGTKPFARELGPARIKLHAKGDLSSLLTKAELDVLGGKVFANGRIGSLAGSPDLDLDVSTDHPSTNDLVEYFIPDYWPAKRLLGPISVQGKLRGQKQSYELRNISLNVNALTLKGDGVLNTSGPRPQLTATFSTEKVNVDPFLPHETKSKPLLSKAETIDGGAPGSRAIIESNKKKIAIPQSRYSTNSIDTALLGAIDADITVFANKLIYQKFEVEGLEFKATLFDKLLTVREIAGKMFKGAFLLNFKFNGRRTPRLDGRLVVSKANIGKALLRNGILGLNGGITDFDLNFGSVGTNALEMVSGLNGEGRLISRGGVVSGIDLRAISDRLKNIKGATDLLSFLRPVMQGGQSRFSSLDAKILINKGIVRTEDLSLRADAAHGRIAGFADLPKWYMNFGTQFWLTEHPKVPAFKIQTVGKIDNPKIFFDFKDLQSHMLQRGISKLIRKTLPGSRQPNAKNAPVEKDDKPRKPRLEELIPGVFNLLTR